MIPMPAVKVCGKDSLACCGFNELWDGRMTAVKSGTLEKHRKYYLFNKKKKEKEKEEEKNPNPNVSIRNSTPTHRRLHRGGSHSQRSQGLFTNWGQGRILTSVNCLSSIFGCRLADLRCTEMSSNVGFFF